MELGVFSLTDIYPGSPDTAASRIDDIIGYGILAEQSGLDVFGIGEHHTRAFAVSSPAVVHAAIARATSPDHAHHDSDRIERPRSGPRVSGIRHPRPGRSRVG
jgi:Luciferase-like monooxygenase